MSSQLIMWRLTVCFNYNWKAQYCRCNFCIAYNFDLTTMFISQNKSKLINIFFVLLAVQLDFALPIIFDMCLL